MSRTKTPPNSTPKPKPDELNVNLHVAAIDRLTNFLAATRWTSEQIKSTVCGHVLVLWPLAISTFAFFFYNPALVGPYPILGVATAALAIFCAWLIVAVGAGMMWLSAALTVASWTCALLMALRVTH